jgi:hypothetical protein
MRTIGMRGRGRSTKTLDDLREPGAEDDDQSAEDDEAEVAEESSKTDRQSSEAEDAKFYAMLDMLSMRQLQNVFGSRASEVAGVFFQHSSRIGSTARFLPKSQAIMIKVNERSEPRHYRKGQLDPSALLSAFHSALNCANVPVAGNEVLVILTGGTPEAVTAGILAGFGKMLCISDDAAERDMMTPPMEDSPVSYIECRAWFSNIAALGRVVAWWRSMFVTRFTVGAAGLLEALCDPP